MAPALRVGVFYPVFIVLVIPVYYPVQFHLMAFTIEVRGFYFFRYMVSLPDGSLQTFKKFLFLLREWFADSDSGRSDEKGIRWKSGTVPAAVSSIDSEKNHLLPIQCHCHLTE